MVSVMRGLSLPNAVTKIRGRVAILGSGCAKAYATVDETGEGFSSKLSGGGAGTNQRRGKTGIFTTHSALETGAPRLRLLQQRLD